MNTKQLWSVAKSTAIKYQPEIMTGIGIGLMTAGAVLGVKNTPKALRILDDAENDLDRRLEKREVVKVVWKCYAPAVLTGLAGASLIVGGNHVHAKRNAVLATAYKISEAAYTEYKAKTKEVLGEQKVEEIKNKIDQDRIKDNTKSESVVVDTELGKDLCYDCISGRYFYSSIDHIKRSVNELNRKLIHEMYISLNEFYFELGLKATKIGDNLGWNLNDGEIDVHFSSVITEDDQPCVVVDYLITPRYEYQNLY